MLLRLPFFDEIDKSRNILLAGAGGGYDIFCGLPLFFALRAAGKNVHLANMSFSNVVHATGRHLTRTLLEVTADTQGNEGYFPELHLSRWFRQRGEEVPVYSFDRTGVRPIRKGYELLVEELELDTIILVDGGTDSLMRGDEAGIGSPVEDISSIVAVDALHIPSKMLVCVGFGVDAFHGVCHAHFLEAVADITTERGFLGMWSLMQEMPEVELYREAAQFVFGRMPNHPSIVSSSILSAVRGKFGNSHATHRTIKSELFINPLMTLLWYFQVKAVADRMLYPKDLLGETDTDYYVARIIEEFRETQRLRPHVKLPM